jgi:hypothetical protein
LRFRLSPRLLLNGAMMAARPAMVERTMMFRKYVSRLATPLAVVALIASTPVAYPQTKPKTVKLTFNNKSKVEIQVYTLDRISKKNDENKRMITPNSQGTSQATLDSGGYIDITFSIVGKNDKNISEYHCMDVKTSAAGKSDLSYNLEFEKLKKC